MPVYLDRKVRDELDSLRFSNKSSADMAALDWEQRSLDDIGRLGVPSLGDDIAPSRAAATATPSVIEAPEQQSLALPRRQYAPEQVRTVWKANDADPDIGAPPTPQQAPAAPQRPDVTFVDGRQDAQPRLQPGESVGDIRISQGTPAAATAGDIDNSSRESFIRTAYPHALEAANGDRALANQLIATAISENGAVGTGRSLGEMGFNVGGIQGVEGTAGSFSALDAGRPRQFAAYNNLAEGFRAVRDLVSGGRYAQAAANYRQTGDIDRYWREVNEAGYSETPDWQDRIASIRRDQVEPLTQGVTAPRANTAALPEIPQREVSPDEAVSAYRRRYDLSNITPDQFQEGQALGLDPESQAALCGIAGAVALQRAAGQDPSFSQTFQTAQSLKEWSRDLGMVRGSQGEIALLQAMNVPARLGPLNPQAIAAEVQAGRPVEINAHGNGGHFFVASGVREGENGLEFNFGNSAAILKRSGGQTWFRLDQLAGLGVGTPTEAIYLGAEAN